VRVLDAPVSLDFGAIGKDFALDRMSVLLGECGVTRALLIAGGGSSLLALDSPTLGKSASASPRAGFLSATACLPGAHVRRGHRGLPPAPGSGTIQQPVLGTPGLTFIGQISAPAEISS